VPETAYGRIIVASQLEYAARDLLQKWFPSYLREVERQFGWQGEQLPAPRNYTNRNSFDALPGEEMPKVVVISPGLVGNPEHPEANGYYRATWAVGIGIAVAGRTEEEADNKVKIYGAAARGVLVQHQTLEREDLGVCYVTWLEENYDDLPLVDQIAQYKAVSMFVGVETEFAVNRFMHPSEPSEFPEFSVDIDSVTTTVEDMDGNVAKSSTVIQLP
jgi:hypothetical protein